MSWWRRVSGGSYTLPQEQWEPLFVVLSEIAHVREKTIAQVALNWLLTSDECIIPIPGARNAQQARENAGASDWRLTGDEYVRISCIGML
jgi:aryl-alcohol dehydrogenase-like predicted oxidoreductase